MNAVCTTPGLAGYSITQTRPLADFLPTEMTNHNVIQDDLQDNLQGERSITREHVQNNQSMHELLGQRGIKPEQIAQAINPHPMEFIDLKTQYAPTQRIAQGLALAMPCYGSQGQK